MEHFLNNLKNALKDFYRNPLVVIPVVFAYLILLGFSMFSEWLNYKLQTTLSLTTWLITFSIFSILVISYLFSVLISMSANIIWKKKKIRNVWIYSIRVWIKNFAIIAIIAGVSFFLERIAYYFSFYFGTSINLPIEMAASLFFIVKVSFLLGIIIFLAFSSFYLVIYNTNILEAIKKSFKLVRRRYIDTLSIILVFFIFYELLNLIGIRILIELVNTFFVVPYLALVLSRFVLNQRENDI